MKIRWGIIGLGTIAEDFSKVIEKNIGMIDGIASRRYEKALKFAEHHKVKKVFETPIDLIGSDEIDVVYIATPNNSHYKYIKECLLHNKHVICEKAMVASKSEFEELYTLAEDRNLIIAEAMTIFNMPLYKKIKEEYKDKLGKLKIQQISFGSKKPYDENNRYFNPELGGGAMLDIGTYAISMARVFLSSKSTKILSIVNKASTGVDDISTILLNNEDNELTTINLSFTAKMPKRAVIGFDKGYIEIEDYPRANKAKIIFANGDTEIVEVGDSEKALEYEFEMMNEAIKNKDLESTSIEFTRDVVKIMDEVLNKY